MYNWYAVSALTIAGWHVPTDDELSALLTSFGSNPGTKAKSTTGWSYGNGTDDYGFTVFPCGYCTGGTFYNVTAQCRIWSSTERSSTDGYYRIFSNSSNNVSLYSGSKQLGVSVRLVRDT